jgi:hypothetical protein
MIVCSLYTTHSRITGLPVPNRNYDRKANKNYNLRVDGKNKLSQTNKGTNGNKLQSFIMIGKQTEILASVFNYVTLI